jgi:diguanylate cyclase (GGDEF)-like protein
MKVLVVEDDPATRLVLSRMLTDRSYDVVACATAEEAVEAYKTGFYPLLFLDLFLPGMDGFSLCRWVRSQPDGDQHLILVGTASHRKEDLQKILDAGADDYIAKPYQADVLEVRLIIAQRRVRVIETRAALETSLRQKRERLHYLATHDPLTELLNRAMLMEKLQNAVQTARTGDRSALLYIDLDNFKLINDSLGHAAGDKLLAKVATALRKSVRSQDVAFRVGGDEFAVLLRDIGLEKAQAISERVLAQIQEFAFSDSTKTFIVGASIGIAMIDGTAGGEEVMGFADSACYSAKAHGRNRVEAYDGSDESMVEFHSQLPRAAEIKEAIAGDRFEVLLQPIVDLRTRIPSFYEALVRLPSNGKLLLPGTFLPVAERFHLTAEIDRQVIKKALSQLTANNALRLAINLSGQSFADQTLPDFIEAAFNAAQVEPCRVTFEITETAMISNLPAARAMMRQLRGAGFQLALDDFGAGFSSFSYLKDLAPNYLKIDGSFILDAENDHGKWIFVEMMNDIAHRLKIKSIAEFVAVETTARKLLEIGVDFAQGFLFGEPGPPPPSPVFFEQETQ